MPQPTQDKHLSTFNENIGAWLEANGVVLLGTTWKRSIIGTMDLTTLKAAIYKLIIEAGGNPYGDDHI